MDVPFTAADHTELIRLTAHRYDLRIRQLKEPRALLVKLGKDKADSKEQQAIFKADPGLSKP